MAYSVLITRHSGLQEYLFSIGAIDAETTVLCHCTVDQIQGQHVIGVLPLHLAVECASITEYPLNIPFELRGTEISAEDMPKYVGKPVTYKVRICPDDNDWRSDYILELRAKIELLHEECEAKHSTILVLEHQYGVLRDRLKHCPEQQGGAD